MATLYPRTRRMQSDTVKVQLTLEWEFDQKKYKEAKEFVHELGWKWDGDPMTAVHFMNQIEWPSMIEKKVIK